jgi:SulP family sulfate permease
VLGRLPGTETYRNTKRYFQAKELDKVLILRFDAKLFFGNTTIFQNVIAEETEKRKGLKLIIINAEAINTLDSTAAHMLNDLADDLKQAGIELVFTTVKGPVRDVMVKAKIVDKLGKQHFFDSIQEAVNNFDGEHVDESRKASFQTNFRDHEA